MKNGRRGSGGGGGARSWRRSTRSPPLDSRAATSRSTQAARSFPPVVPDPALRLSTRLGRDHWVQVGTCDNVVHRHTPRRSAGWSTSASTWRRSRSPAPGSSSAATCAAGRGTARSQTQTITWPPRRCERPAPSSRRGVPGDDEVEQRGFRPGAAWRRGRRVLRFLFWRSCPSVVTAIPSPAAGEPRGFLGNMLLGRRRRPSSRCRCTVAALLFITVPDPYGHGRGRSTAQRVSW